MATSITERPNAVNWSKNPVKYHFHTDTVLTTAGLSIEVKLYFKFIEGGAFEEVISWPLTPDKDGNASIDWQRVIDSKLNFLVPPSVDDLLLCDEQTAIVHIMFREVTAADSNPAWTDDVANTFYVIKGGLPEHRWHKTKYWDDFTYQWKQWMTWKKNNFKIAPSQYCWLTYRHDADTTGVGADVRITLYYTDGTSDDTTLIAAPGNVFKKYGIYRIPVGVVNLALDNVNPAKKIVRMAVVPRDEAGVALTNAFNIYIDYSNYYDTITMQYFNSTGGFDSCRVLGDIEPSHQRTADMAESNAENDGVSNVLPAMQFTQQVEEQMMFRGNVGLLNNAQEQDVLRDLLLSKEVYEYKFSQWYRINITNQSTEFGARSSDLFQLPLEWSYGYINESYAPDDLNLLG
jgi:hypothetical protein